MLSSLIVSSQNALFKLVISDSFSVLFWSIVKESLRRHKSSMTCVLKTRVKKESLHFQFIVSDKTCLLWSCLKECKRISRTRRRPAASFDTCVDLCTCASASHANDGLQINYDSSVVHLPNWKVVCVCKDLFWKMMMVHFLNTVKAWLTDVHKYASKNIHIWDAFSTYLFAWDCMHTWCNLFCISM